MSSILRSILAENDEVSTYEGYSFEKYNYEQDFVEVFDDYSDILANQDAVERLHEIHDGLESIIKISEESLEEGGLNARDAGILNICSNILVAPLGIENPILSPDAFGVSSEALPATISTVEKQKGTIEKIWDAIRKAMVAIKGKILEWTRKIFSVIDKVKNKNNALATDISNLTGKTVPDDKKEFEFNASLLLSNSQSQKDLIKNIDTLGTALEVFLKDKKHLDSLNSLLELATSGKDGKDAIHEMNRLLDEYLTVKGLPELTDIPKSMAVTDMTTRKYGELPGNRSIYSYSSQDGEKEFSSSGYKIGPSKDGNDAKKVKFNVFTIESLNGLVRKNSSLIAILLDNRSNSELRDKIKENIIKVGDNIKKEISSGKISKEDGKNKFKMLKMIERHSNSPFNELISLSAKVINSSLNLAGTMVKRYS